MPRKTVEETAVRFRLAARALANLIQSPSVNGDLAIVEEYGDALIAHHNAIEAAKREKLAGVQGSYACHLEHLCRPATEEGT